MLDTQYILPEPDCYLMRSFMPGGGYVTLSWPKDLSLRGLNGVKEIVAFQLDVFIEVAQRKDDAEAEYASWFPDPLRELTPHVSERGAQ